MKYVSVTFDPSFNFNSPESWYARTEGYAGILYCLAKNNTVINIKQINYGGDCLHKGVQYRFVNFYRENTWFPRKLYQYIKGLEPGIVLVQGLHNPFKLIQLGMKLPKRVKIIVQHHAEKPGKGIKRYLHRIADHFVDAYLFASQELGAGWVKNGSISSAKKVHEVMEVSSIFSPMDKTAARKKTGVTGDKVFLWVGRLNDNKDPLTVTRAFLKFSAQQPLAKLYMIYHTDELFQQVQQTIDASGQKNAITLIGNVPHAELQYWFSSADIILSGSHYEGSGTAICEAMSCGCMPVVTNISSFRMITDGGKCGLLYQPGNESELFSALNQTLVMDIEEKQKLSLEYFKASLSFEAIAGRIQEIAAAL